MKDIDVVLLSHGEKYDLIVDIVGDEGSLEFCTLVDFYLDDNGLDVSMRANGTSWSEIKPLIDEFEERAKEMRAEKRGDTDE